MLNQAKSQIMQDAHAQFGIISQNISTKDKIKNVNSFIQLPGNDDSESLNLIILNILIIINLYIIENMWSNRNIWSFFMKYLTF